MKDALTRDEEIVLFHYRLGVAITQWSYVEASIGDIVINLFSSHDLNRESIAVGFYTMEGFRAKLKLADEIVHRKLASTHHLNEWEKLVAKARTQSVQRNDLAHWALGKYWDCQPGKRVVLRPWVAPKPKNEKERNSPPPGSKRIMDLVRCATEFKSLGDSFQEFLRHIFVTGVRLRESPEPEKNQMTVHKLRCEIREVFLAPQKSSATES
jgi:hypothetical protein